MRKKHSGIYWDRVFKYIGLPIIVIVFIALMINFLPQRVKADYQEWKKEQKMWQQVKEKQKENIAESKFKKEIEEYTKVEPVETMKTEECVQQGTLKYQTKQAKKIYPIGTYIKDSIYGAGKVSKIDGFEISTKEGWNFNLADVENGEREVIYLSYREYKKMLKG